MNMFAPLGFRGLYPREFPLGDHRTARRRRAPRPGSQKNSTPLLTRINPRINFLNVMMNEMKSWVRQPADPVHRAAHQVLTRCPVCGDELRIVRLQCGSCGSALEGNFTLGRLQRLTRDQLQFVEVFIKSRGKIKDVEEELGVSYPTVVARLNEVVQAMGFEVRPEEAEAASRRQQILDELAAGTITATEAAGRLRAL